MHVLRRLWEWLRTAVDVLTEQAADFIAPTMTTTDGALTVNNTMLETLTRRTVAVVAAGIGTTLLFAPWINIRFASLLFDSLARLAYSLWSGYEGVPD